jgi:hypothetical protein
MVEMRAEIMGVTVSATATNSSGEVHEIDPDSMEIVYDEPVSPVVVNNSTRYTVWVGGTEVIDYEVTREEANEIARRYRENGYTDVAVQRIE